jgi:ribosomal RNA-processing protein 36
MSEPSYSSAEEEKNIQEELEEMELGKIVKAKAKLQLKKSEKIDKEKIEKKIKEINKSKSKAEPKEFSALLRPQKKTQSKEEVFRRDPRFDDLSGKFNPDMYKKNYEFVYDKSKEYIEKVKDLKKKSKKKINETDYELIKKQVNFVKGWIKSKDHQDTKYKIEKEFKAENEERSKQGLNPIYLKQNQLKKVIKDVEAEKRTEDEKKGFLKRKKHKEMIRTKKSEKII